MSASQLKTVSRCVWNPLVAHSSNRHGAGATRSQCVRQAQRRDVPTGNDAFQLGLRTAAGYSQLQQSPLSSRPETAPALLPNVAAMVMAAGLCFGGDAVAGTQGDVFENLGIEKPTAGSQTSVYQAKPKTKKTFITEGPERTAPAIKPSLQSKPAAPPAPKPVKTPAVTPAPQPAKKPAPSPPSKPPQKREVPKVQPASKTKSPPSKAAQTQPKKVSTPPAPKSIQLKEPVRESTQGLTIKGLEVPEPASGKQGKLKFAPKPPKPSLSKGQGTKSSFAPSIAVPGVAIESSTQAAIVGVFELALVAGALSLVSSSTKK